MTLNKTVTAHDAYDQYIYLYKRCTEKQRKSFLCEQKVCLEQKVWIGVAIVTVANFILQYCFIGTVDK